MEKQINISPRVLVSACLLGEPCRYDGASKPNKKIIELLKNRALLCCPEQLGGMSTPRAPSEIVGEGEGATGADVWAKRAQVIDSNDENQTACFIAGACEALTMAQTSNIKLAILKERSPSCDPKRGVCAALLLRNGIEIIGSEEFTAEMLGEIFGGGAED